jgi:hypothetical protein
LVHVLADNLITTPGITEDYVSDSTNTQFRYETKQELDSQLGMEYGNVSSPMCIIIAINVMTGHALILFLRMRGASVW